MRFYHAAFLAAGLGSAAAAPGAPADDPADAASLRGARQLGGTSCPAGQSPLYLYFVPDYSADGLPYFALRNLCADGYPEVASFLISKEKKPSNFLVKGMEGETKVVMGSVCLPRTKPSQYKVVIENMREVRFTGMQRDPLLSWSRGHSRSKFGTAVIHGRHLTLGGTSACPEYFNCGDPATTTTTTTTTTSLKGAAVGPQDHQCPHITGYTVCGDLSSQCVAGPL